jgi:hypothetical protein
LIHRDDKGCSLEFVSPSRRVDATLYFDQNPEVLEEFLKRHARKKIQYRYALDTDNSKKK